MITVTIQERKAIESLERLAKKWPQSISVFSWSGSLVVMKSDENNWLIPIQSIEGIPNDGGDPSTDEVDVNRETEIDWEY